MNTLNKSISENIRDSVRINTVPGTQDPTDQGAAGRNTIQRQLIFNAVKEMDIHANAEQVYEYVAAIYPSISKATVYRNLGKMADTGELLNIGSFYGAVHYDHNCHEHYHFICEKCKKVHDINIDFPNINELAATEGLEIKSHHLSFKGLCSKCKSS